MQSFGHDVMSFGNRLKIKWAPSFVNHVDAKIPTSAKVVGTTAVVAVSAVATLAGGPLLAIPSLAKFAVMSATLGGGVSYVAGKCVADNPVSHATTPAHRVTPLPPSPYSPADRPGTSRSGPTTAGWCGRSAARLGRTPT